MEGLMKLVGKLLNFWKYRRKVWLVAHYLLIWEIYVII